MKEKCSLNQVGGGQKLNNLFFAGNLAHFFYWKLSVVVLVTPKNI